MNALRYRVESYDESCDDWDDVGQVILPPSAPRWQVEHALAAVGIYAPRGLDELHWIYGSAFDAIVWDTAGTPIVRLSPVSP